MCRLLAAIVGVRPVIAHGKKTPVWNLKTVRFAVGCSRLGEIWLIKLFAIKVDITTLERDHITRKTDYTLDQFPIFVVWVSKGDNISPVGYRIPEQIRQPPTIWGLRMQP